MIRHLGQHDAVYADWCPLIDAPCLGDDGDKCLRGNCEWVTPADDGTDSLDNYAAVIARELSAQGCAYPQTRQFVRDTCAGWGLELLERTAPVSYRELVLGLHRAGNGRRPWPGGFPGAGAHFFMYQRLKQRPLDQVRRELVTHPRRERLLFIAGRRRAESKRRVDIPLYEADGSIIWASPLAMWTKLDMNTYRLMCGDVPVNSVSEKLHMSGECLCGAFAKPGELEEIRFWYPDVAAEIDALEAEVRAAGYKEPFCRWGNGTRGGATPPTETGKLCSSCDFSETLWEEAS